MVAEFFPVARALPKVAVDQLRGFHLDIAGLFQAHPHVAFAGPIEFPPFWMPKHRTARFFLQMKQIHFTAKLAVIALFRFFDPHQMRFELFFVAPARAVNPLQLRIARIAAPVRPGQLHQLERFAHAPRRRQMRAAAQVDPIALAVHGDVFAFRQFPDPFGLKGLAFFFEVCGDLFTAPDFTLDRHVAINDFTHTLFDGLEIFSRERLFAVEVVIKTVVRGRAEGDLRARIQFLHRHRQHVRAVVAQHFKGSRFIFVGDDCKLDVVVDGAVQIP